MTYFPTKIMASHKFVVGEAFNSWEDFKKIFDKYCRETHQKFGVTDSKTIEGANLKTIINFELKYYKKYYHCHRGGVHKPKGNNKRKRE